MKTEIRIEAVDYIGTLELAEVGFAQGLLFCNQTGEIVKINGDGLTVTVVKID